VNDAAKARPEPQAILTPLTEAAIFLILTVDRGSEEDVRDLLSDVPALTRSVGFRIPNGGLICVVGVGSQLWDRLFGRPRPAGLHTFRPLAGSKHTAVSTPGDLLFHIRANRFDLCFELAQRLLDRLRGRAQVVDEVHGFKSFDERDLLGFVDGTENPVGPPAFAAAIIGGEDDQFAGGSYVVVQKYVHNLDTWDALPVEEQERVIGRTKLSDIEMPDDVKPSNSHVALNTIIDDNGDQRQILRFNMPFGRVGAAEFGTYYIAYAKTPDVIEEMLTNMFIGKPPGNTDRVLDFSTALTGTLFFVPGSEFLADPPGFDAQSAAAQSPGAQSPGAQSPGAQSPGGQAPGGQASASRSAGAGRPAGPISEEDVSLGIGSLKGELK
jgi:porphyrinogen peroxidase